VELGAVLIDDRRTMMSVYCDQRSDKKRHWRYRAKIRLHNGRTERISGTPAINTKLGALAAERAHIERALLGRPNGDPEEKEVLTLTRFIDEVWWPTYPTGRGNRPTTIHEKESHIRLHLKPALGRLLLPDVNAQKVTELFGDLRTQGHSRKGRPAREGLKRRKREEEKLRATRERNRKARGLKDKSIRNIRTTLNTILSSAVEWGYLAAMPRLPKVKVDDPQWEWYRAEEAKLLVAAVRDEWERAVLLFPLGTGARMGEQIAIRWGDVDWQSRMIHIRQSAPGGKEIASTKSGRHRAVPLTPELVGALRAIEHRGEFVFVNEDGTRLRPGQFHEMLWGAQRRAGLRRIPWHGLRHSFASILVSGGTPLRVVQRWLGHSSITTSERYGHLAPGAGDSYIGLLNFRGETDPLGAPEHENRANLMPTTRSQISR
jgi:integrase